MTRVSRIWDPWRQFDRLQGEMNRLLSEYARPQAARQVEFPAVNIWQKESELALTAEIAGLQADALDITVSGDSLMISGVRQAEQLEGSQIYHRKERYSEPFSRTIELPYAVDPDKTDATYEKGVLTIRLQRPEAEQPKKVTVKPR
jgi:HSP20 family protein